MVWKISNNSATQQPLVIYTLFSRLHFFRLACNAKLAFGKFISKIRTNKHTICLFFLSLSEIPFHLFLCELKIQNLIEK